MKTIAFFLAFLFLSGCSEREQPKPLKISGPGLRWNMGFRKIESVYFSTNLELATTQVLELANSISLEPPDNWSADRNSILGGLYSRLFVMEIYRKGTNVIEYYSIATNHFAVADNLRRRSSRTYSSNDLVSIVFKLDGNSPPAWRQLMEK